MRKYKDINFDDLDDALNNHGGDTAQTSERFCNYMKVSYKIYGKLIKDAREDGATDFEFVAILYDAVIKHMDEDDS